MSQKVPFLTISITITITVHYHYHHHYYPLSYHAADQHHKESGKSCDRHLISSSHNGRTSSLPSHLPPSLLQLCQYTLQSRCFRKQRTWNQSLDLLNETDDALRDGGRIGGVLGHGDGIALAVEEPAQLPQITLPLHVVL